MKIRNWLVLACLLLAPGVSAGGERGLSELGAIQGSLLKVIAAAMPALEAEGLQVDEYVVVVVDAGDAFVVLFEDREKPEGQRGSTDRVLSFEVELRKDGLKLVRSNFVR